MKNIRSLDRLRRIVGHLAIVIGVSIALAVPLSLGLIGYLGDIETQHLRARMAAERVADVIRHQRHPQERPSPMVAVGPADAGDVHVAVLDSGGHLLAEAGTPPPWPNGQISETMRIDDLPAGEVVVRWSLWNLACQMAAFALLGTLLGMALWAGVHMPLDRALARLTRDLTDLSTDLRGQIANTAAALELAQVAQIDAEAASNAKSEFLANMSHELRTPLNAIIGFSEIMQAGTFGALDPRYRDYAHDINTSGRHLLGVINDILDLTKIEAGHIVAQREPTDLGSLIDDCLRLVGERAAATAVSLHKEIDAQVTGRLDVDPVKFRQILLNLLSNAVKFTPPGGQVRLALDATPDGVRIAVADSGIGMSPAEIELALQPFRQVDNSLTRKFQGTGLGLPLAKALTELHGGTLAIDSLPNRGTTVAVTLPGRATA